MQKSPDRGESQGRGISGVAAGRPAAAAARRGGAPGPGLKPDRLGHQLGQVVRQVPQPLVPATRRRFGQGLWVGQDPVVCVGLCPGRAGGVAFAGVVGVDQDHAAQHDPGRQRVGQLGAGLVGVGQRRVVDAAGGVDGDPLAQYPRWRGPAAVLDVLAVVDDQGGPRLVQADRRASAHPQHRGQAAGGQDQDHDGQQQHHRGTKPLVLAAGQARPAPSTGRRRRPRRVPGRGRGPARRSARHSPASRRYRRPGWA